MRLFTFIAIALFFGMKSKGLGSAILKTKVKEGRNNGSEEMPQLQSESEDSVHIPPKFNISFKLNGFSPENERKMRQALSRLSYVVKTNEFKQRVLMHEFRGKRQFYKNRGLTNLEIYNAILDAAETLSPEKDNVMDLNMTLYTSETNTVGYTYPNVSEIWVNTKYFKRYTLAEVANNAMHEWLHKIGFEHSYYNNDDRPYTVPYAIGEIVEDIMLRMGE